jgi:uncharacterized protein YjiS (DUF1127 family)
MIKRQLMRLIVGFRKMQRYRKTVHELQQLNNRDLADLGIHRSEIESVARQSIMRHSYN